MVWLIIFLALGLIVLQIWQDQRTFPRFEALQDSRERRLAFRQWTLDSFVRYGVLGLAGLYALGHLEALAGLPGPLSDSRDALATSSGAGSERLALAGYGLAGIISIGLVAGAVSGFFIDPKVVPKTGVGALLARNWKEAGWTSVLSINAGVIEEIFFRALLLVAFYEVSGSLMLAALLATLLFALAHAYQGLGGILSSGIIGALFMAVYITTGALWLVMLLHALLDLRGLVLLPYSLGWLSANKDAPT